MLTLSFPPCPQACLVPTAETVRLRYFMDRLLERQRPVMLVGSAGTGKSVLVGDKLSLLDTDAYVVKKVPFNYYTTSAMLQGEAAAKPRDFCGCVSRGVAAGRGLFMWADGDKAGGNGFKLKEGRFRSDVRRKFFTQRAVRPWHCCPESCGCPIPRGAQGHGWALHSLSLWEATSPWQE